MIEMSLNPLESTRTKERPCQWQAVCELDGKHHQAIARMGASNALARVLVRVGIADQPVQVFERGRLALTWPSLFEMAKWTYAESPRGLSDRVSADPFAQVAHARASDFRVLPSRFFQLVRWSCYRRCAIKNAINHLWNLQLATTIPPCRNPR